MLRFLEKQREKRIPQKPYEIPKMFQTTSEGRWINFYRIEGQSNQGIYYVQYRIFK